MNDEFLIRKKITELENHIAWMRKHMKQSAALQRRLSEISELRANIALNSCLIRVESNNEFT